MVRLQETLRSLAMSDESFVEGEAGLGLDPAATAALDPKTAALLRVAVWGPSGHRRCAWSGAPARRWRRERLRWTSW